MSMTSLSVRAKHSYSVLVYILWYRLYFPLAILLTYLTGFFVVWSLNFGLIAHIIFEEKNMGVLEKFSFFNAGVTGVFSDFSTVQTVGIQIFSILFAINFVLLVFLIKQRKSKQTLRKSGGFALVFALLSTGCIACGTSVIAPLFITLGVTSAAAVQEMSTIFSIIASLLLIYSIYKYSQAIEVVKSGSYSDSA